MILQVDNLAKDLPLEKLTSVGVVLVLIIIIIIVFAWKIILSYKDIIVKLIEKVRL